MPNKIQKSTADTVGPFGGNGTDYIAYGTAGFRAHSIKIAKVATNIAPFLANLSARNQGQWIGICFTASHNPIDDNGVKIVDCDGGLVGEEDERRVERIVNGVDGVDCKGDDKVRIVVARDTRPSGRRLVEILINSFDKLEIADIKVVDAGLLTTPQLHSFIFYLNTGKAKTLEECDEAYFQAMINPYNSIFEYRQAVEGEGERESGACGGGSMACNWNIDCSNGVGSQKIQRLLGSLRPEIQYSLFNNARFDLLNDGCGADWVKTGNRAPANTTARPWEFYASMDGDADRLVCFTFDDDLAFRLIDGDKIACLAASTICKLMGLCHSSCRSELSLGVVQTAYANGASTLYLEEIGVPVITVSTGVKHLHRAASQQLDIGIYWEANGHGTILFSPKAVDYLRVAAVGEGTGAAGECALGGPSSSAAAKSLLAIQQMSNQLVGDAFSDLLLVQTMLRLHNNLSVQAWANIYTDLPNKIYKLENNLCNCPQQQQQLVTTDADRTIVEPQGLQERIDEIVYGRYPGGRAFLRASGTEPVLRLYVEHPRGLAYCQLVHDAIKEALAAFSK